MIDDNGDDEKTRLIHGGGSEDFSATVANNGDEEKTRIIGASPESTGDEEKTKIYRQNKENEIIENQIDSSNKMKDPPVGWLVIIDGPGRGNYLTLGYGQNTLGRGESNRLRLDFGDKEISRESNALATYDPKTRKFYLSPGTGQNLSYLDDKPVLSPTEIKSGAKISIGQTMLRLVQFCDKDFDWQD